MVEYGTEKEANGIDSLQISLLFIYNLYSLI